jgi:hypothetical protein
VTLGFFSATRTRTRENPYPRARVRVLTGTGMGSVAGPEAYIAFAQRRLELDLSDISPDPSVQFSRETWFDHVRDLYAVSMQASGSDDSSYLGLAQRDSSVSQIIEDVRFVFHQEKRHLVMRH